MARSSQVRSTERREGVSMAEVVIDDMAIGNPVSPLALHRRFWASFPGIHIAQFPFQVIGNCGVISLMRCSNHARKNSDEAGTKINVRIVSCYRGRVFLVELRPQLLVRGVGNMTVSLRWGLARICPALSGG